MTTLVACSNCRRHFRSNAARCPFCAALAVAPQLPPGLLGERRSRAALLALAVGTVAVAACTPPSPTPDSPKPPPPATAPDPKPDPATNPSASASAQVPTPSAPATPAAPAIAQNPTAPAYGGPPPPMSAPSTPVEAVPGPDVKIRGVSIVGGSLPNAERVVSTMQPGFRSCYARGLKERPDAEGDVIVKIRVGSAGQILGVNVQQTARVPATVASCMATRAAASQFDVPPGGKGVEVVAPTTLVKP